jgi:hypothetical protein
VPRARRRFHPDFDRRAVAVADVIGAGLHSDDVARRGRCRPAFAHSLALRGDLFESIRVRSRDCRDARSVCSLASSRRMRASPRTDLAICCSSASVNGRFTSEVYGTAIPYRTGRDSCGAAQGEGISDCRRNVRARASDRGRGKRNLTKRGGCSISALTAHEAAIRLPRASARTRRRRAARYVIERRVRFPRGALPSPVPQRVYHDFGCDRSPYLSTS